MIKLFLVILVFLVPVSCSLGMEYEEASDTSKDQEVPEKEQRYNFEEITEGRTNHCEPIPEIPIWTMQVVEGDCLIYTYSWDEPKDYDEQDRVGQQWNSLRSYLFGWIIWHNKTYETRYNLTVRQNTEWRYTHVYQ